jgi:tripartite-type tricarboxylate transporter receptor subunit TctC
MDSKSKTALRAALCAACAVATLGWSVIGHAQANFPTRPVRLINPYTPGGSVDLVGRAVAAGLTEIWGQQVIVDNRPGAGTQIGTEAVVRAEPDGYTMLVTSAAVAILKSMYKNMRFDPSADLTPVILCTLSPFLLVIHPSLPVKTPAELVKLARSQPGKIAGASSGIGTTNHLTLELFKALAKVDVLHVPYKGGGPAIADLIGGQTQMHFNTPGTLLGHVKAGKLRALGVTSTKRTDFAPDLPTIAESGVPGFESTVWYGVYGPKGLPSAMVKTWNEAINRYLKTPKSQEHWRRSDMMAVGGTPEYFADFHKRETERWSAVMKSAGIEPQ